MMWEPLFWRYAEPKLAVLKTFSQVEPPLPWEEIASILADECGEFYEPELLRNIAHTMGYRRKHYPRPGSKPKVTRAIALRVMRLCDESMPRMKIGEAIESEFKVSVSSGTIYKILSGCYNERLGIKRPLPSTVACENDLRLERRRGVNRWVRVSE